MFPFRASHSALAIAAGILGSAGSDCRLVQMAEVEPAWKTELRDDVAESLAQEQWQPRWEWSPRREWDPRETHSYSSSESFGFFHQSPTWLLFGGCGLLADRETSVSVAAIAMSRLGDPQGHDELIRLSHHPDYQIRIQVIEAMGTGGQTRFIEPLVGIAWTAKDDRVKQAVLKSLEQLVPPEKHPPAIGNTTGTDGKIKLWAEWWDQTQNPAAGRRSN